MPEVEKTLAEIRAVLRLVEERLADVEQRLRQRRLGREAGDIDDPGRSESV